MYHKNVVVVVNCHDDCGVPPGVPRTCVGTKFCPVPRAHEQAGRVRSMELEIRLASGQGWSILHTPSESTSQFDPTIDKERKIISNLRRNMPVLPDSPECAALRADMEGNLLNSRFQQTHKNKSIKAHGR